MRFKPRTSRLQTTTSQLSSKACWLNADSMPGWLAKLSFVNFLLYVGMRGFGLISRLANMGIYILCSRKSNGWPSDLNTNCIALVLARQYDIVPKVLRFGFWGLEWFWVELVSDYWTKMSNCHALYLPSTKPAKYLYNCLYYFYSTSATLRDTNLCLAANSPFSIIKPSMHYSHHLLCSISIFISEPNDDSYCTLSSQLIRIYPSFKSGRWVKYPGRICHCLGVGYAINK